MELNKIYGENCLETMARMPDGFVQSVITSPPYYGLRSYKTEPQIWDSNRDHNHAWGDNLPFSKQDLRSAEKKREQGAAVGGSITFNDVTTTGNSGAFCPCGAWRGELGLEPTFQLYIKHLLQIFAEVKRVLKPDGTVFVNLGDSYGTNSGNARQMQNGNGGKSKEAVQTRYSNPFIEQPKSMHKSLLNIPHRFFIAMTDELQMIQRNNINWWKRASMPSSAKDRWTVDFESIGFFTKNAKYKFNQQLEQAVKGAAGSSFSNGKTADHQLGRSSLLERDQDPNIRNARTTWDVAYEPSGDEHYASYPTKLVERMMLAGTDAGDLVYDPFGGTATTALTAHRLGRNWICSELQPKYVDLSNERLEPHLIKGRLF